MKELIAALEESLAAKEAAEVRHDEVEAEITSLEIEIKGLQLAVARRSGEQPSENRVSPREAKRWRERTRTDAIVAVLEESEDPLGPADITGKLRDVGRDDLRHYVAASLAYLQKQRRVHRTGRARWVAGPPRNELTITKAEPGGAP